MDVARITIIWEKTSEKKVVFGLEKSRDFVEVEFEFLVFSEGFLEAIRRMNHGRVITIGKLAPDFLVSRVCKLSGEEDDALSRENKRLCAFFTAHF